MSPFLYGFIALQLLVVAWLDLRKKVISNYWHVLNILLSLVFYIFLPDFEFKWEVLIFPVGYVLIGFLLFLLGVMGAGDSKYLASLSLIVPLEFHWPFFEAILMTTISVGGLLLIGKIVKDFQAIKAYAWARYWQGLKSVIKSEFSYGPVIFLAWILLGVRQWT